jgi:hypothetical protein
MRQKKDHHRLKRALLLPMMRRAPIGANMIPMMRRVGRTVFGVRIGCHAFSRCCLKAVSMLNGQEVGGRSELSKDGLAGRFQLPLSLLFSSSGGDEACCELFARRKRAMMDGETREKEKRVIDNSLAR